MAALIFFTKPVIAGCPRSNLVVILSWYYSTHLHAAPTS